MLTLGLLLLSSCHFADLGGFFLSDSDVDERFAWSLEQSAPDAVSITSESFSFLAVTDTHYYQDSGWGAAFQQLSGEVLPDDEFLIIDGDLMQSGYATTYDKLLSDISNVGLPFYTAVGNHDLYHDGWKKFRELYGPSVYSLGMGSLRLICLDTANGTLGEKQWKWLKKELRSYTEEWCVIMTHANLFASGPEQIQQITDYQELYAMMDLFESSGVDLVLSGHAHKEDDRTINGVRYVTMDTFKEDERPWDYYRIRISPEEIDIDFLRL